MVVASARDSEVPIGVDRQLDFPSVALRYAVGYQLAPVPNGGYCASVLTAWLAHECPKIAVSGGRFNVSTDNPGKPVAPEKLAQAGVVPGRRIGNRRCPQECLPRLSRTVFKSSIAGRILAVHHPRKGSDMTPVAVILADWARVRLRPLRLQPLQAGDSGGCFRWPLNRPWKIARSMLSATASLRSRLRWLGQGQQTTSDDLPCCRWYAPMPAWAAAPSLPTV